MLAVALEKHLPNHLGVPVANPSREFRGATESRDAMGRVPASLPASGGEQPSPCTATVLGILTLR